MCVASLGAPALLSLGSKWKGAHPLCTTEQLWLKPRSHERYCCGVPSLGQLWEPRSRVGGNSLATIADPAMNIPVLFPACALASKAGQEPPTRSLPHQCLPTLHQGGHPCSRPKELCPKRQEG